MKRWIFVLSLITLICAGCRSPTKNNKSMTHDPTSNEHVIIDWVDLVQINDVKYTGVYSNAIADSSFVGEKLGEVEFNVDQNISDSSYKVKNGDATYLEEGTAIYEVKDMPGYIAVKDKTEVNGYQLFANIDALTKKVPRFQDLDTESVEKIEIYEALGGRQLLSTLSDKEEITAFMEILENGKATSYEPDTSSGDPGMYDFVLYHDMPIAYLDYFSYDGNEWYWYEREMSILSGDMERFVE